MCLFVGVFRSIVCRSGRGGGDAVSCPFAARLECDALHTTICYTTCAARASVCVLF